MSLARRREGLELPPVREMVGTGIAALVTSCGPHVLVIRAELVHAVMDSAQVSSVTEVGRLFGFPTQHRREGRAVCLGEQRDWFGLGPDVRMRHLPAHAFQALPTWLFLHLLPLPLAGLVALDGGYGYELDVARAASAAPP